MQLQNSSFQRKLGALITYANLALSIAVGLFLIPFVIQRLGPSEYGLYRLVGVFIGYVTIIDFGMANTVTRYVAQYRAIQDRKGEENFLAIAYIIYTVIAIIVIILGLLLNMSLPYIYKQTLSPIQLREAQVMFFFAIINLVLSLIGYPILGALRGQEQYIFPGVVNIFKTMLESVTL